MQFSTINSKADIDNVMLQTGGHDCVGGERGGEIMLERRPTVMTLAEVARYLRINRSTVYRMARDGTLPSWKLGNVWRFKKEAIERWIATTQRAQQQKVRRKA